LLTLALNICHTEFTNSLAFVINLAAANCALINIKSSLDFSSPNTAFKSVSLKENQYFAHKLFE
jgi:hypothetical protein